MCCNSNQYEDVYMLLFHPDAKLRGCNGGELIGARVSKLKSLRSTRSHTSRIPAKPTSPPQPPRRRTSPLNPRPPALVIPPALPEPRHQFSAPCIPYASCRSSILNGYIKAGKRKHRAAGGYDDADDSDDSGDDADDAADDAESPAISPHDPAEVLASLVPASEWTSPQIDPSELVANLDSHRDSSVPSAPRPAAPPAPSQSPGPPTVRTSAASWESTSVPPPYPSPLHPALYATDR